MPFRKKEETQIKSTASPELIADVGRYVVKMLEPEKRIEHSSKATSEPQFFLSDNYDADRKRPMFKDREEKPLKSSKYFVSDSVGEAEIYYQTAPPEATSTPAPESLAERIKNIDEPFMATLFHLIDEKELTDAQVYKKANIDRRLFSKMRKKRAYIPSFRTAVALAISLELDLEQTTNLLRKAGYSLSHSKTFDIIIEYFISNGKYNIFEINEVLYHYDQVLLGG